MRMNAQETQSQGAQPRARTEVPQIATCFPGHQSPSKMLTGVLGVWRGGNDHLNGHSGVKERQSRAPPCRFYTLSLQLPNQILLTIPPQT